GCVPSSVCEGEDAIRAAVKKLEQPLVKRQSKSKARETIAIVAHSMRSAEESSAAHFDRIPHTLPHKFCAAQAPRTAKRRAEKPARRRLRIRASRHFQTATPGLQSSRGLQRTSGCEHNDTGP